MITVEDYDIRWTFNSFISLVDKYSDCAIINRHHIYSVHLGKECLVLPMHDLYNTLIKLNLIEKSMGDWYIIPRYVCQAIDTWCQTPNALELDDYLNRLFGE